MDVVHGIEVSQETAVAGAHTPVLRLVERKSLSVLAPTLKSAYAKKLYNPAEVPDGLYT